MGQFMKLLHWTVCASSLQDIKKTCIQTLSETKAQCVLKNLCPGISIHTAHSTQIGEALLKGSGIEISLFHILVDSLNLLVEMDLSRCQSTVFCFVLFFTLCLLHLLRHFSQVFCRATEIYGRQV